jgi:hypothetical protein
MVELSQSESEKRANEVDKKLFRIFATLPNKIKLEE